MKFVGGSMRRFGAALVALTMMVGIAGCGSSGGTKKEAPAGTPPAQTPAAGFDWKKYSGKELNVWLPEIKGYTDFIQTKLPEFEKLTGIKVTYQTEGVTPYRAKQPVELAAKSEQYDVMGSFLEVEGRKYLQAGWYEPLDPYIKDSAKTSPDWDFNDFPDGTRKAMQLEGKTLVVPWEAQTLILYYRKDLFKEKNIKVPETFDEMEAAAAALADPAKKFWGVTLRGGGYLMTTPFVAFLYGYGGSWLDASGKPALNTPQALKAFETYGRLAKKYGAPDMVSWSWEQPAQVFMQGNSAMFLDINLFPAQLEDPAKSKVVGQVGYAVVPAGPSGRNMFTGGWSHMINPFSKKKEMAWLFIQWATSKEMFMEVGKTGYPVPRSSFWNSDWKKQNDKVPEFTKANTESYKLANAPMNPPVVSGLEARQIVGTIGDISMQTADPAKIKAAADEANSRLDKLIQSTK